jgi:SAM-dependent methyltransferase
VSKTKDEENARYLASAREGYDLWADSYDDLDNPLVAMSTLARASLAPTVNGARVLELGCGTGRNRDFFLAAGARAYVGVDESDGMLERARRRAPEEHTHAQTRWVNASLARPLPRDLRDFDLVFLCLVLEHIEALTPVFAECLLATGAQGKLRIHELHAERRADGTRAHFRLGDESIYVPSFAHDARDYATALAASGWGAPEISTWSATEEACAASPKLRKYLGKPVLLEVAARKI